MYYYVFCRANGFDTSSVWELSMNLRFVRIDNKFVKDVHVNNYTLQNIGGMNWYTLHQ